MNYLAETARLMLADRKGLLAMNESDGTYDKRSAKAGITQTAEARHRYRELIITTPGFAEWISGVILYNETIRQARADRTPFVKVIAGLGIIPGIKVDTGAKDLAGHVGEKITEALDGLRELTGSDEPEAGSPANLPSRARAADGTTIRAPLNRHLHRPTDHFGAANPRRNAVHGEGGHSGWEVGSRLSLLALSDRGDPVRFSMVNDHALSSGFLDALQRETFDYFVHEANPLNGLIADKTQAGSPASIAAVGFALSSYPVGVERGFMTRAGRDQANSGDFALLPRQRSKRRRRRDRIQRLLLPLSRHGERKAGLEMRAVDDRQRHPHCRHVDCRRVLLWRRRGRA